MDSPNICILFQYCPKGSLQVIFNCCLVVALLLSKDVKFLSMSINPSLEDIPKSLN